MHARLAALALPAAAAVALWALRGPSLLRGPAMRPFALLVGTGLAGLVALAVALRRARRVRAGTAAGEAFLAAIATPLGDAALAFDAEGRLVWANGAAAALCGRRAEDLVGRGRDALGEDLSLLLRGHARGPAAGRVGIPTPAGRVEAMAAAARVPGPVALDVALLRVERLEPPGAAVEDSDILPAPAPPPLRVGPAVTAAPAQASLAAVAAEIAEPISRARAAAALLRLALPRPAGEEHLARVERELEAAEAALAALRAPLPAAVPRPVDVAALLSESLRGAAFAPGVRLRRVGGAVAALADAEQLREALGHLLALASAAMPSGGELGLRTAQRGPDALIEIADTGAGGAAGLRLALAERLVAAQGGRLERAVAAGRGEVWRVVLPAAGQGARRAG
jgi:signal transduction histidine kinase